MKKYFSAAAMALALLSLGSCSNDESETFITYYPVITLEGPVYSQAPAGTPYVDPGFEATLDGQDIKSEVVIKTDMDLSNPAPGYYTVNYSAVNKDGFSASATRYVLVADANDVASGYYANDPESFRDYNGVTFYGGSWRIVVAGNGDGTYFVSDMLGGWYCNRAGYGTNYAMQGEIAISGSDVSLLDSYIIGWGDGLEGITDGTWDASTGTLHWVADYTSNHMLFDVTLHKL